MRFSDFLKLWVREVSVRQRDVRRYTYPVQLMVSGKGGGPAGSYKALAYIHRHCIAGTLRETSNIKAPVSKRDVTELHMEKR